MSRYIDADAFHKMVRDDWDIWGYDDVLKAMRDFPTADVRENVYGKWILHHPSQLWECTNCHEKEIRTTDFCPWCGADMRGEKDG